ncbi:MAG: ATP-binding protein [Chloroflexi bacterium]|nr:ATP-binding protein [Chloroflexota bacterium]
MEIHVVRIVQEALSNVRKHAAAQHAWVELKSDGSRAEIAVQDDGRGFDAERCIECNGCHFDEAKCGSCGGCHFGLQTMRERARMIGGELTVHSAPGQGARMELRLPLEDSWRTGGRQRVSRLEGGSR